MKKIFSILIFVCTVLLFVSCTGGNSNESSSEGRGDDQAIIEDVEFFLTAEDLNNELLKPGESASPSATVYFDDGTQEIVGADELTLSITEGEDFVSVTDDYRFLVDDLALSGTQITLSISYLGYSHDWDILVKKDPTDYLDAQGVITDYTQIDSLINKERALPANYAPSDLVDLEVPTVLSNPEINQLRHEASAALSALFEEASSEGYTLRARSGYRSYATQNALFQSSVDRNGLEHANKYSARPGHSEHQTGLAIDITASSVNNQLSESFGGTPEGIWVAENAHQFGFIIRYPKGKEDITGYNYEPWHLRYVGVELATEIYLSGLTMEEYFGQ